MGKDKIKSVKKILLLMICTGVIIKNLTNILQGNTRLIPRIDVFSSCSSAPYNSTLIRVMYWIVFISRRDTIPIKVLFARMLQDSSTLVSIFLKAVGFPVSLHPATSQITTDFLRCQVSGMSSQAAVICFTTAIVSRLKARAKLSSWSSFWGQV